MSINSAMLAGASGMRANASTLAAISDNIANVNTVGFKRLRSDFSLAAAIPEWRDHFQRGRRAVAVEIADERTGLDRRLLRRNPHGGLGRWHVRCARAQHGRHQPRPLLLHARGQFSPNSDGYLQNAAGYYLLGWPVGPTGTVNSNPTNLDALETVRVSGIAGGAEASARLSLSANLQYVASRLGRSRHL